MLLHIFVFHRPNFEENGRIFEVVMNEQAFYRAKREEERERVREKEIRINLKMLPHWGGGRERTFIIKSFYESLRYVKFWIRGLDELITTLTYRILR